VAFQGNRLNASRLVADDGFEECGGPGGHFAGDVEGVFVLGLGVLEEVVGDVPDDGEVLGPVAGAQAAEVVVEDDVEDPVEAVFDAQWARAARARRTASAGREEM
jgi:hypothetical protein